MVIGVLALQGAFIEHQKMLEQLGVETFQIRNKDHLQRPMDGIVLPGGESTPMYRILRDQDMVDVKRLEMKSDRDCSLHEQPLCMNRVKFTRSHVT